MRVNWLPNRIAADIRGLGVAGAMALSVSALIAAWCAAWSIFGDWTLLTRWGAYAFPWLGVAALLACIPAVVKRRYRIALIQALPALLMLLPIAGRAWPGRLWNVAAPSDIRVVTFNITDFNSVTLARTYDRAAHRIAALHPDVVFLQQIGDPEDLLARFAREPGLRGLHAYPLKSSEDIILSRYPLEGVAVPFGRSVTAIANIGSCRLALWDLHGPHGEHDVNEQADFFRDFRARFAPVGAGAIVAGDMNSTEFNSVQAPLRDVLGDAFASTGFGAGFTYPTGVRRVGRLGPLVRIDHIFFTPALTPTQSFAFGGDIGSDHYALFAAFRLPGDCASSPGHAPAPSKAP
jgi:endonuclease/exonuclease/phosphatase (EEP) superfamily protein YafD